MLGFRVRVRVTELKYVVWSVSSSKQAASSKQASSAGPFLGPRATGVPKSRKKM